MRTEHRQRAYDVRCEWGRHGVELLARECAVIVIVDVLSFCTSVDVAVGRGARVLPQRWRNPYAAPEAATRGAVQAGRREGAGPSLRPSSRLGLAPGTVLALPSPNGASLCAAAAGTTPSSSRAACATLVRSPPPRRPRWLGRGRPRR